MRGYWIYVGDYGGYGLGYEKCEIEAKKLGVFRVGESEKG